ncbi:hypothetical protein COLSTE_02226 [Collinsella stercoris DSM 13279]|uniref:Uncharacterized protein n=1 Tax=Collinsella stercoris DSM 13279 TaxID=445975 RepID=B6GDP4_9ACTN|nr:hypothetical protein COLSTE_02226 [Collinsella stercoris DSM 13279]
MGFVVVIICSSPLVSARRKTGAAVIWGQSVESVFRGSSQGVAACPGALSGVL